MCIDGLKVADAAVWQVLPGPTMWPEFYSWARDAFALFRSRRGRAVALAVAWSSLLVFGGLAVLMPAETLGHWSIIDRLPQITAPTLVIAGEFDEATPETWQPYVDQIAGAESHVFPDTSHCSHLEKPEEVRAVVAAFLARHDATARV